MLVKKCGRSTPVEGAYADTRRIGLPLTSVVTHVTLPHLEPVSDFVTRDSAWSWDSPGFFSIESSGMAMAVPWPFPPAAAAGASLASHSTRWCLLAYRRLYVSRCGFRLCSCMSTAATGFFLCSTFTECMHCWNLPLEARPFRFLPMYLGPGCGSMPSSLSGRTHTLFGFGSEWLTRWVL